MAAPVAVRDVFVEANGLRHHLVVRGHPGAPVVVLVHGLTQQAHVFDAVAEGLADRYHVYCLDVRGRGESAWGPPERYTMATYVDDLAAVVEALELHRMSLAGTSMGGLISMHFSARRPDLVVRLAVNDIGPEASPAGLARIMRMLTSAPLAFIDLKAVAKWYREDNPAVLAGRSDEQVMEYARRHVRKSDSGLYTWKMDPAVRNPRPQTPADTLDAWASLRAVSCPLLLIRGAESDVLSPELVAKMREVRPEMEVVEVPGVGHAPSLMEPVAFKALRAFLDGT